MNLFFKTEIKLLKRDIKRKFGTISRFAKQVGVDEYELRKMLQRIENNRSKYAITFDPNEELERIKKLTYLETKPKTLS